MRTPVDATATPAWAELARLHDDLNVDFRAWFADDPTRAYVWVSHDLEQAQRMSDIHLHMSAGVLSGATQA